MARRMRECVERLVEAVEEGYSVVFEAPTGYGKSSGAVEGFERISRAVPRLVHVLPLRAIVEQVYRWALERLGGVWSVGYQASGLGIGGKAPFMAADYVVSTYDSFLVNLFRGNVAEHGLGHYEVPRAHILSSIVYLDEAHMGLDIPSFKASLIALGWMGVQSVVATATLAPSTAREMVEILNPSRRDPVKHIVVSREGVDGGVEACVDREFFSLVEGVEWSYEYMPGASPESGVDTLAKRVAELVETGLRVFVGVSTPEEAVRVYKALLEAGVGSVALVHGRLAVVDRLASVSRLGGVKVLVGTSAVEAGVDADFDALVTTAGGVVGLASLIQRMGRVCRRPWSRRCERALVYLVGGEEARRYAELFSERGVNPRIPDTYRDLLELETRGGRGDADTLAHTILGGALLLPSDVESIAKTLCDMVRVDNPIVPLIPLELLEEGLAVEEAIVTVSLSWLSRSYRRVLDVGEGGCVKVAYIDSSSGELRTRCSALKASHLEKRQAACRRITTILYTPLEERGSKLIPVGLAARGYRRGTGLV